MKIAIVLPNLSGGGAERLAIYLADEWLRQGHSVEFILMLNVGELVPLVPAGASVVDLHVRKIRHLIVPLARHLRRSKPDVLWAGMWPMTSAVAFAHGLAGRPGRLFLTDHNHMTTTIRSELKFNMVLAKLVTRLTYPFAAGVTAVSQGVADDMLTISGMAKGRIKVIYNPTAKGTAIAEVSPIHAEALWGNDVQNRILTVGSLKSQKNQALLINAFARIAEPLNARLIILGEGGLRQKLEAQVRHLGLQDRVSLPGFQTDPYPWFKSADLFVLSSDYEGFGNVLVEALESGLPIVSTRCLSGPDEILANGRYGRLVPVGDEAALAAAMQASLTEEHDRAALIRRSQDFLISDISEQYLAYFGGAA